MWPKDNSQKENNPLMQHAKILHFIGETYNKS